MRYFISDLHFNHFKVILYSNRPFLLENRIDGCYCKDKKVSEFQSQDLQADSVKYMNETLINNWNSVVTDNDTIYFMGDFGYKNAENLKEILSRLNGYKIIILGNHDKSKAIMLECGFNEAYDKLEIDIYGNKMLLSHYPYVDPRLNNVAKLRPNIIKNIKGNDYTVIPEGLSYYEEFVFLLNQKTFLANPQKNRDAFHKMKGLISKHIGTREINRGLILGHGHTHSTEIIKYNMINFSCEALNYIPMSEVELLKIINTYKESLNNINEQNYREYEYYSNLTNVVDLEILEVQKKFLEFLKKDLDR